MKIGNRWRLLALIMLGPLLLGASDRQEALMNEIEQNVKLPPGASTLWVYVRKYTYMKDKTVIGIYVRQTMTDEPPRRTWVDQSQMPQISGGGCGVVTVFYDPAKKASPDAMCNPSE
jgi:hypothetical protein